MKVIILPLFLYFFLFYIDFSFANNQPFTVAGYLPEWRYEGANFEQICSMLTHLIFFSLEPSNSGQIEGWDRFPGEHVLHDAKESAKKYGCKLMICFGGNGRSNGFSKVVRNQKKRKRFVANVANVIKKFELDGVDYNWEYPGYQFGQGYSSQSEVDADYQGLASLLQETRSKLGTTKIISLAYYPDGRQEKFIFEKLQQHTNLLHIMSYDQTNKREGSHSSFEFASQVITQALSQGLIPSQLTLGLPFYGRLSTNGDWRTYEDIVQRNHPLSPHLDEVPDWDPPYTPPLDPRTGKPLNHRQSSIAVIGFNGLNTIKQKTQLALDQGIGGVMIWEVGQDCRISPVTRSGITHHITCPNGKNSSLLSAIHETISSYSYSEEDDEDSDVRSVQPTESRIEL